MTGRYLFLIFENKTPADFCKIPESDLDWVGKF
jgi:hypothetical protein